MSPREVVWQPRIHVAGDRIFEALGRDPDDFVRLGAQLNGRADDRRIAAKARAPERVAQHHAARAGFVVAIESRAAQRARSERVEVVARDPQHAEPLRLPVLDEVEAGLGVVGERRDVLERSRMIAKRT